MKALLVVVGLVAIFGTVGAAQSSIDRGATVLVLDSQNRLFVKSVVAISGDVVTVTDGLVTVNAAPASITLTRGTQWGPQRVADGQLFVAGNPLQISSDHAAAWGLVPSDLVVGTVQPRAR